MPDVSMCKGTGCPLREECYRYKAKPNSFQSFFKEPPYKDDQCGYFMKFFEKTDVCKKCGAKKRGTYQMYAYCDCDKFPPYKPIKETNDVI